MTGYSYVLIVIPSLHKDLKKKQLESKTNQSYLQKVALNNLYYENTYLQLLINCTRSKAGMVFPDNYVLEKPLLVTV